MATVEEVITALDELIDEAETLGSGYQTPIFNEKLELWTKRAFSKLRQLGFLQEAERFSRAEGEGSP